MRSMALPSKLGRTSFNVHNLAFRSSITLQSYARARSRSRYGKLTFWRRTYRNSVMSSPPMFSSILCSHIDDNRYDVA